MSKENPTYKEVWDRLSNIDVSEHIEVIKTKSSFQPKYLSWAWAWGVMMKEYPEFRYEFTQWEYPDGVMKDVLVHEDKSVMVEVTCRIGSLQRTMWLAVMNYKHESVSNPSTAEINKAKMRCLVKCMAMYGLGHYIYAGEDLPEQPKETAKKKPPAKQLKETAKKKVVLKADQKELNEPIELRNDYISLIKEGLNSDVFDENNKASISNFLAGVTDTTTDQELEKWANRIQSLIKENK
jgi:hypothetical protein